MMLFTTLSVIYLVLNCKRNPTTRLPDTLGIMHDGVASELSVAYPNPLQIWDNTRIHTHKHTHIPSLYASSPSETRRNGSSGRTEFHHACHFTSTNIALTGPSKPRVSHPRHFICRPTLPHRYFCSYLRYIESCTHQIH